jgi:hypothetical protein
MGTIRDGATDAMEWVAHTVDAVEKGVFTIETADPMRALKILRMPSSPRMLSSAALFNTIGPLRNVNWC